MNFDIIGDIHGHSQKLIALLQKLGYQERSGVWRHPDRTVIFVGDFIDRGPGQLGTLNIVRRMVDAGTAQAVMGNHEFNAIAWHTPDPSNDGLHLRPRTNKNRHQHVAFLAEVESDPNLHREIINWFVELPLWLDLPELRVIHACWHSEYINELSGHLRQGNRLTPELVVEASRKGTPHYRAVETLTKGLEIDLPSGISFFDKDGHERHNVRIKWWDTNATTYKKAALIDSETRTKLPDTPIPDWARVVYEGSKPVFIGHYWHSGALGPLTNKIACVDYSAGKGGPLVAYRFEGENELQTKHFVAA